MAEPGKERDGGALTSPDAEPRKTSQKQHSSSTEGTNRDFDESGDAKNQGHGHPREQRDANE
jgi:hypothetical protein